MKKLTILLFSISCISFGYARIITVDDDGPADFNNIQAAIDDANDGDEIVIELGTYTGDGNRDITFRGKAITVRGSDPNDWSVVESTVIDCNGSASDHHRGFIFQNNEDSNAVLAGVMIKNGYHLYGGGVFFLGDCNPIVKNCYIFNNTSENYGGGISSGDWSFPHPAILNCIISNNSASAGGGFGGELGNASFDSCVFKNNTATYIGGGFYTHASRLEYSPVYITNCDIIGNISGLRGGGFFSTWKTHSVITNTRIIGNNSPSYGAMYFDGGYIDTTISNCTIADNSGGIGLYLTNSLIVNSILWANDGPEVYIEGEYSKTGRYQEFKYSILQGGWAGVDAPPPGSWNVGIDQWGPGMLDDDPCFVSPGYWDDNNTPGDVNDDYWVEGDYHLQSEYGRWDTNSQSWVIDTNTSLAIDAGDPDSDYSNEPDPHGYRINMGAYGNTIEASKGTCFPNLHPDFNEWVSVGKPDCWCNPRQCHGDADGLKEGNTKLSYWYVGTNDLNIMAAGWNVKEPAKGPGIASVPNGICADFAHDKEGSAKLGYWRVGNDDLNAMAANWFVKEPTKGPGVPADCLDVP